MVRRPFHIQLASTATAHFVALARHEIGWPFHPSEERRGPSRDDERRTIHDLNRVSSLCLWLPT